MSSHAKAGGVFEPKNSLFFVWETPVFWAEKGSNLYIKIAAGFFLYYYFLFLIFFKGRGGCAEVGSAGAGASSAGFNLNSKCWNFVDLILFFLFF